MYLVDQAEELFEGKANEKVAEWIDYFFTTWFSDGQDFTVAKFPRESWNQFENTGPRTSNNGEAYNGKLGLLLNKSHPNIWWFIELIKSENTHYVLIYHRMKGDRGF